MAVILHYLATFIGFGSTTSKKCSPKNLRNGTRYSVSYYCYVRALHWYQDRWPWMA